MNVEPAPADLVRARRKAAKDTAIKRIIEDGRGIFSYATESERKAAYSDYTQRVKTGIITLDNALDGGLYPGVVTIAGGTGAGKTAFCCHLARNVLEANPDAIVIYFATESELQEIETRIAANTLRSLSETGEYIGPLKSDTELAYAIAQDSEKARESDPATYRALDAVMAYMHEQELDRRFFMLPANFSLEVNDIIEVTYKLRQKHPQSKILFILDYLQTLRPSLDEQGRRLDVRLATDEAINNLEAFAKSDHIHCIITSSMQREKYLQPFSVSSLKESGMIEYSSDVILGLQLAEIRTTHYASIKTDAQKEKFLDYAASQTDYAGGAVRHIVLTCKKSRKGGAARWDCYFQYEPKYHHFRPCNKFSDDELYILPGSYKEESSTTSSGQDTQPPAPTPRGGKQGRGSNARSNNTHF